MIDSAKLRELVSEYALSCIVRNRRPSFHGLAEELDISYNTARNAFRGEYCSGKPYTDTPSPRRRIDNRDFEIIRRLFLEA